jgi:hypothetical protein
MDKERQCVSDLTQALEIKAKYARGYNVKGAAKEKLGDSKDAIPDDDKAINKRFLKLQGKKKD